MEIWSHCRNMNQGTLPRLRSYDGFFDEVNNKYNTFINNVKYHVLCTWDSQKYLLRKYINMAVKLFS